MSSSTSPHDYPSSQLKTLFLRVPFMDWPRVRIGEKTEFRTKPRGGSLILGAKCPTPVVAYTANTNGAHACKLMVMTAQWREYLIDIADKSESLAAEGFKSYDEFKGYWKARNGGVFRALQPVVAHRIRPWGEFDEEVMGLALVRTLYGKYFTGTDFSEHANSNL